MASNLGTARTPASQLEEGIMPFKFLPAQDNWEKALAGVKVKPDAALSKALADSFKVNTDELSKRLAMLPKIQKLATDFKKSKEVTAAGPNAAKLVQELIDVIPSVRKDCEAAIKAFAAKGACEIDVQINIEDWNGQSFEYATGYATFTSPGLPTVNKIGKLSGHGLDLEAVKLRPEGGGLNLRVSTGSRWIEGHADYEFKRGQKMIQFKAVQLVKKQKTKAKTLNDVTQKFGLEGTVGVEFKVLSVGGKATKESEYKQGYEDEVEWELEFGFPTFQPFTQTK